MIIVQLMGGLGNQLFQYAYGKSRALELNVPFKIDLSFFKHYEWHSYSLSPFNIELNIASDDEIYKIKKLDRSFFGKLKNKIPGSLPHYFSERSLLFDSKYLNPRKESYIKGYWQSEKYFIKYRDIILRDFEIIVSPSNSSQAIIEELKHKSDSVSLHIRRGNYVNVEAVNKVHGTTPLSYYYSAIKILEQKIKSPEFFIFSDDIEWAKEHLNIDYPTTFIDFNDGDTDYEDLRLMSLCQHNIIANSTFSWWGAYLNKNPQKMVFAPYVWFASPIKNLESAEIIPSSWYRI